MNITVKSSSTKVPKVHNVERTVSSSGAGKIEYPHTKNEAGPLVYTIQYKKFTQNGST